jgi:hypothetical protein
VGVVHRLKILFADADRERRHIRAVNDAAVFRVDMQNQHIAPIFGAAQGCFHRRERIIDERVNIPFQVARGLCGLEI